MKLRNQLITITVLAILATIVAVIGTSSDGEAKDVLVLSKDNIIVLNEPVMPDSTAKIISQAMELDGAKTKKPIYLFLLTPGGSIQSGLELIEALSGLKRPVNTVTSFAASMGFQIAQNLKERLIMKSGVLMSHRAAGSFDGSFGGLRPSQIDNRYNFWLERLEEMDAQTVARTKGKQTMDSYKHAYASEMWLTGSRAVEKGYADKVVFVRCDETLRGTTKKTVNIAGLLELSYDISDCPVNSGPTNVLVRIASNKGFMEVRDFLNKGGQFGPSCLTLASKEDRLCALDTGVDLNRIEEAKTRLRDSFDVHKLKVLPYTP
jgi:ATP-dependent Clp protease, protease subunit